MRTLPKNTRKAIVAAVVAGSTAMLAAPVAGASTRMTAANPTSTVVTAWPQDITSLDPANLSNGEDHELARNIYQTLIQQKFEPQKDGSFQYLGTELVPGLAESWTIGRDEVTFHIRPNVKFYGTNDYVTAQDVKWSLDRLWSTPGVGDLQANGLQEPSEIHVVNASTVTIDFVNSDGQPTPVTPTLMAIFDQFFTSIVDEAAATPHETKSDPTAANWLRDHAVGTGPYYIASRQPGVNIVLQADPDSWEPQPYYKTVDIRITTASIGSLLQSGTINFGEFGMTNEEVNTLAKSGLPVYWQNTGFFDMFAITSDPTDQVGPLANLDVRQAIAYAMPYKTVLDDILYDRGTRAYSIVTTSAPEYTPAWDMYNTDLSKAEALMKAAGNPKIDVPLYYLSGDVDQTNTAILIQASLKSIGITATLTPETQAGLFDVVDARSMPAKGAKVGPPGLELFNWSAWTSDPKIVIGYWATKGGINNYSLWSSSTVDTINNEYSLQPTSAARTAGYERAQRIIAAAAPVIPIVETGTVTVTGKGMTGVSFSPGGSGRFWMLHPVGATSRLDALSE
jgi:peptide/nickel transport system substrate-binding protein